MELTTLLFKKALSVTIVHLSFDIGIFKIFERGSAMSTGLNGRHRDNNGEISRKHGNTLVGTLRKIYGNSFAQGQSDEAKLSDVLEKLNEPSLSQLVDDHGADNLEDKVRQAALD